MPKSIIAATLLAVTLVSAPAFADCRGCCSRHGGVVCKEGKTLCADGTPLSAKCKAKGCNKCGGLSTPKVPQTQEGQDNRGGNR